ncbi:heme ABC transporter permease CcmC [Rickettsiales endosymbiont of Stachyamoeba lipophora]|uniref:heme ABC transporter permease CcmC n=1 Tax=Rickettsiales endosymbiont of Stachyamoeba lipophora TaxID=2486578 RepID=UPI000F65151E|nr:heme ABC transporter permease CcmC [Rickettsiales endosymbiont of Stachyamoeba lipophora]AZL15532.1 heme ABC transporter permease [Rickettsiales endosymbiont of Stachyamoeba lipophora]
MFIKNFKPSLFCNYNKIILPICGLLSLTLFIFGLYYALITSPADYQQGDLVRIMYIHVPAAWVALNLYFVIGVLGINYLIWQNNLNILIAESLVPIGTIFSFITLLTGSIWGKPTWGTFWVWDARLTSMLILFILYLCLMIVLSNNHKSIKHHKIFAVISIIGAINVPIIKFSVEVWNSLHQPASILRKGGVAIDSSMLPPLLLIFAACISLVVLLTFASMEYKILSKKLKRTHLYNIAKEH